MTQVNSSCLRPITSGVRSVFFGPSTINSLRSQGRDELFPSDCGRDEKNMGKLCFGDPELCRASESESVINVRSEPGLRTENFILGRSLLSALTSGWR